MAETSEAIDSSPSVAAHRAAAEGETARCAVLTVSDTRTLDTDRGGALVVERLEAAGHRIVARGLVADDAPAIDRRLRRWLLGDGLDGGAPDVVVTTGGTGISSRDTTVEVVEALLDKRLEGFGEIFRMLSFEQVGAAAMLSRAVAGLAGETLVFTLPGSTAAVTLALDELIVPELPHLVWERRR